MLNLQGYRHNRDGDPKVTVINSVAQEASFLMAQEHESHVLQKNCILSDLSISTKEHYRHGRRSQAYPEKLTRDAAQHKTSYFSDCAGHRVRDNRRLHEN